MEQEQRSAEKKSWFLLGMQTTSFTTPDQIPYQTWMERIDYATTGMDTGWAEMWRIIRSEIEPLGIRPECLSVELIVRHEDDSPFDILHMYHYMSDPVHPVVCLPDRRPQDVLTAGEYRFDALGQIQMSFDVMAPDRTRYWLQEKFPEVTAQTTGANSPMAPEPLLPPGRLEERLSALRVRLKAMRLRYEDICKILKRDWTAFTTTIKIRVYTEPGVNTVIALGRDSIGSIEVCRDSSVLRIFADPAYGLLENAIADLKGTILRNQQRVKDELARAGYCTIKISRRFGAVLRARRAAAPPATATNFND